MDFNAHMRNTAYLDKSADARLTSTAGWFDLRQRKLAMPPPNLAEPLRALDHTDDFQVLPNSAR